MRLASAVLLLACGLSASCQRERPGASSDPDASATRPPDTVVLVTIDTLRADRVGAYGWRGARTPALDGLAARGARFERAYATAPITLTSHASLLTGLYPPGHGARHNGVHANAGLVTLAAALRERGFATAAFVAAFPLDRRFGLDAGFDLYSDRMPRGADGRPANERPGRAVVDEAIDWLGRVGGRPAFMWVHLFEPHAPYVGDAPATGAATPRSASDRYDDEIARADTEVGRLLQALGPRRSSSIIVLASDHGEAFGEHGEIGHSVFVYDTTLRVPLVIAGAGVPHARLVTDQVSLVDVFPTILELLGAPKRDVDGASLMVALQGKPLASRELYAESFAPLLDFGWSALRTVRTGNDKYIAAPRSELYDLAHDPGEERNLAPGEEARTVALAERVNKYSGDELPPRAAVDRETAGRLQSLGYASGSGARAGHARPDPKDRRELAARIAQVTSGELEGVALRSALDAIVRDDPRNGQMQMRLGYVLADGGNCRAAESHFRAAIDASVPSADPALGLARCLLQRDDQAGARRALIDADRLEPGNPVVAANLGLLALDGNRVNDAIDHLRAALEIAPDLNEARFALARAYARAGRRDDAVREARDLLTRLPPSAPQRAEVERLLAAVH